MSNRRIIARIVALHEQYRRGEVPLDEFARGVRGHAAALEGVEYHRHADRIARIMHSLQYPLPRDGNIVQRNEAETLALLSEFDDWLREVGEWADRHEPAFDPDE
jgi:hypothetical protein